MVGGDYTARNIAVLKPDGRLVNIAFLNGSKVSLDLMPMMLKRLTLTGFIVMGGNVNCQSTSLCFALPLPFAFLFVIPAGDLL